MAERIKVSSEAFEECISNFRTSLDVLSNAIQIYQQAIATLQQDWTGRAYAAMALKAFQLISSIMKAVERANDAVDELQQAEKIFAENEQKNQTEWNNTDTGMKSPFGA